MPLNAPPPPPSGNPSVTAPNRTDSSTREKTVRALLASHADFRLLNGERRSALMLAESEGHADIVKLLPTK